MRARHLRRDDKVQDGRGVKRERERQGRHCGPVELALARVARLAPRARRLLAPPEPPRRAVRLAPRAVCLLQ